MTTDPRAWLAEAQARANNATKGPWATDQTLDAEGFALSNNVTTGLYDLAYTVAGNIPPGDERDAQSEADAEWVAAARTEHPAMAAALTAVLDVCDAWDGRATTLDTTAETVPDESIADTLREQAEDWRFHARVILDTIAETLRGPRA